MSPLELKISTNQKNKEIYVATKTSSPSLRTRDKEDSAFQNIASGHKNAFSSPFRDALKHVRLSHCDKVAVRRKGILEVENEFVVVQNLVHNCII